MTDLFNLATSVSGSWCCACWPTVTLSWLNGTLEKNRATVNFVSNTCAFSIIPVKKTYCTIPFVLTVINDSINKWTSNKQFVFLTHKYLLTDCSHPHKHHSWIKESIWCRCHIKSTHSWPLFAPYLCTLLIKELTPEGVRRLDCKFISTQVKCSLSHICRRGCRLV